jgi:predicted HicB family RNase H-like nuclease
VIYKGYVGRAVFDEEERTIRGRVVNLWRDGIDFESERADQIEDEFRTSVDEYLAFCREHDRKPEVPIPAD